LQLILHMQPGGHTFWLMASETASESVCLCIHWVVQNTKHPFLIHAGSLRSRHLVRSFHFPCQRTRHKRYSITSQNNIHCVLLITTDKRLQHPANLCDADGIQDKHRCQIKLPSLQSIRLSTALSHHLSLPLIGCDSMFLFVVVGVLHRSRGESDLFTMRLKRT
jgi:hypothetical protein